MNVEFRAYPIIALLDKQFFIKFVMLLLDFLRSMLQISNYSRELVIYLNN